ncbi:hypothetical protein J6590_090608, partial [Homalodisca vitripennis]
FNYSSRPIESTVSTRIHYSGDEENNCNSETSLTVATRKTTATVERRLQWRRGKQLQQ